jgi:hypothetical protein
VTIRVYISELVTQGQTVSDTISILKFVIFGRVSLNASAKVGFT